VIFLLKSGLPFTILLVLGAALLFLGKSRVLAPWVWIFPLGWVALMEISPRVFLRYELPAYPALFLLAAMAAQWLWGKRRTGRQWGWIALFLPFWQAASVAASFPAHFGYFNDLVPRGAKPALLGGGAVDQGQDLKRLGRVARERGWDKVKLGYIGQEDPTAYGLPSWEPWSVSDLLRPQEGTIYVLQKGWLLENKEAVERGFPVRRSWAAKMKPSGRVGETWVYFEVPGKRRSPEDRRWLDSVPYLIFRGAAPET
jgi:hypothetical protein